MPVPTLPVELWIRICTILLQPIPRPLSRPSRSAITQPHLAVLMRTSKLFKSIVEPLLYRNPIVDNLPLFIRRLDHLRSGLSLTRTLHLEYMDYHREAPYAVLLKEGGSQWRIFVRTELEALGDAVLHRTALARRLIPFLEKLILAGGLRVLLPSLRVITVSAIYGPEEGIWRNTEDAESRPGGLKLPLCSVTKRGGAPIPTIPVVQKLWNTFISSGDLTHICLRSTRGYYAPPSFSYSSNPTLTRITHFTLDHHVVPLALNAPNRWVLDEHEAHSNSREILSDLLSRFTEIRNARQKCPDLEGSLNLEMFCSTDMITRRVYDTILGKTIDPNEAPGDELRLAPDEEDKLVKAAAKNVRIRMSSSGAKGANKDRLEWYRSADSPLCEACGSGPPIPSARLEPEEKG